jgi:phosphate transport system substrate-binding protein
VLLLAGSLACAGPDAGGIGARRSPRPVVRIIGSDTMVNLIQAWAEEYRHVRPDVIVQVAGGGSGVGIAGLIDGTLDLAAASREIRPTEKERARLTRGIEPREVTVARDALAVYVHKDNPLPGISLHGLAEIYGEHGTIVRWSQLGVRPAGCASDAIIRIGRQNNSGTFAYFRDVVLGRAREYRMGSIDQSGSKDVVALVARTPCAIGYSGLAFATPEVRPLAIISERGAAVSPSESAVRDGSYPLARPLYLYAAQRNQPADAFLEWTLSPAGQHIARDLGFVAVEESVPAAAAARGNGR